MNNRDKLLVVVVLLVAVILLPYFFFIQGKKEEITNLENKIVQLNERYKVLQDYEANREFYQSEIVRLDEEIKNIVNLYPADIDPVNYTYFLQVMEYSDTVDISENIIYTEGARSKADIVEANVENIEVIEPSIRVNGVQYAPNTSQLLADENMETEYTAIYNSSTVDFICANHFAVNHLLDYLMAYENPMVFSSISFKFDDETGVIKGDMTLCQYAVAGGEDREYHRLGTSELLPNIDELDMRGNEDYGIFGPNAMLLDAEALAAAEEAADAEAEEAEEEEEE